MARITVRTTVMETITPTMLPPSATPMYTWTCRTEGCVLYGFRVPALKSPEVARDMAQGHVRVTGHTADVEVLE